MPCTPPPILPKLAERMLRSSEPGSGLKWLNRLKISDRNCNCRDSWKRMDLESEKSTLFSPGSRIAAVRGEVPKRPNLDGAKAAVLNQCWKVRWLRGRLPS